MQHNARAATSAAADRSRRGLVVAVATTLGLTAIVGPAAAPAATAHETPNLFTQVSWAQGAQAGFGYSMSADGTQAVVGAPGEDGGRGAAYVIEFRPDRSVANVSRLTASDGQPSDGFGMSVGIDRGTVVVGAPGDNAEVGSAYVFTRPDRGWFGPATQTAKLTAPDSGLLGYSVAVSGSTVIAGDYRNNRVRGAVRVYSRPLLGWQDDATPTQTMRAGDARDNDQLGRAVAIDGNTVVAGAMGSNGRGAAYVFVRSSGLPGVWPASQTAKLTTATGSAGDDIGASVSIDGGVIAVGAPRWGSDGAAFIYTRPGTGWRDATQTARLLSPGDHSNAATGTAVDVDGTDILVGAANIGPRGGATSFRRLDNGEIETLWQVTPPGNVLHTIGYSVAALDDYVLLGDPRYQGSPGYGGSVLILGFPGFSAAPLRLGFPDTAVGATSPSKTVTVSNPGSAALTTAVEITGAARGSFAVTDNSCARTVYPTQSCTVSVSFTPTSAGAHNAFLQFTDRADGSPHRIPLTGTGTGGPGPGPGPGPDPAPGARPGPPSQLTVAPKRKKITAGWRAGAGAADYRVVVRGKRPPFVTNATTASLRHTVKTLRPGKRYKVCVRSLNNAGKSAKICISTRTKR